MNIVEALNKLGTAITGSTIAGDNEQDSLNKTAAALLGSDTEATNVVDAINEIADAMDDIVKIEYPTFAYTNHAADIPSSCDMSYTKCKALRDDHKDASGSIPCLLTYGDFPVSSWSKVTWVTGDLPSGTTEAFECDEGFLYCNDGNIYEYNIK